MAYYFNDLTNKRFGKLVALEIVGRNKTRNLEWLCKCDCGNFVIVPSGRLVTNNTKSCGCYKISAIKNTATKHGYRHTRLYEIWLGMKKRCNNKNCKAFNNYGGRGIKVCKEWEYDFKKFYDWSMTNGYEDKLSIDRIDNNGNYSPNNCRWSNRVVQANNKRNNIKITFNNKTLTTAMWSRETNLNQSTITNRIKRGWDIEKALTTPTRVNK